LYDLECQRRKELKEFGISFPSDRHSLWLDILDDDCLTVELKAVEKVLRIRALSGALR
jgi:hypothetical protein